MGDSALTTFEENMPSNESINRWPFCSDDTSTTVALYIENISPLFHQINTFNKIFMKTLTLALVSLPQHWLLMPLADLHLLSSLDCF